MGIIDDTFDALTGKTGADASIDAANISQKGVKLGIKEQRRAAEQGLGFLSPFSGLGRQGLAQAGFLTDPNQQFEFLQNNPLFQLALDNANTGTNKAAAAGSRLSAGDTLQQLSNNVLLSASPLIQDQKNSIGNLLNFGSGIATTQANTALGAGSNVTDLITSGASAEAAGVVGAGNARTAGANNLLTAGLLAGGIFR